MLRKLRKPRYYIPLAIALIIGLIFFLRGGGDANAGIETQSVERTTVATIVSETGSVNPADDADLSFERAGRVTGIEVEEGERVSRGDVLATIDDTGSYAELLAAQARLDAEEARLAELIAGTRDVEVETQEVALKNAEENLERVRDQHDTLVSNAKSAFLSNDLNAYLTAGGREGTEYDYTPPTVSGSYTSDEEGRYILEMYRSNAPSNYSFTYSGLESGTGNISTTEPQPLGTRGLYIEFPEDFARGTNIEWTIDVPNERSTTFVASQNALNAAIEARESAISSAEATLAQAEAQLRQLTAATRQERIDAQHFAVEQMRASLAASEYAHESATLRAPFSGTVTDIMIDVGEVASAGPALRLISDGLLEIEVEIPEADIAEINVGDRASMTFDAYSDLTVESEVIYVAPSARVEEGVPVFPVRILLDGQDERIRAGLSADVDIAAAERPDVIAIPARAIFQEDDVTYVRILDEDDELQKIAITTGLRGTDGLVEVVSGLQEGDDVVIFIEDARLAELETEEE